MLRLNMKPTGWFHVAWSDQIPNGGVLPLRYFGTDLVAFRASDGELSVLDAHCRHQGAHLGYGGAVIDDCVACPYHGWRWDRTGANTLIPYEDHPSMARLTKWNVVEQHGLVFLWHDPAGGPARDGWELPQLFTAFAQLVEDEADYHPCYPNLIVNRPSEPIHPQLLLENLGDATHFRYVHVADDPHLESFDADGAHWHVNMAFTSNKSKNVELRLHSISGGIGAHFVLFHGRRESHRVIIAATPVDEMTCDIRLSYFLQRVSESREAFTPAQQLFAESIDTSFEQDAKIWRHQVFVQKPVFAPEDAKAYSALRRWSEQFYESDAAPGPTPVVDEFGG